jgi:hypothetical protein
MAETTPTDSGSPDPTATSPPVPTAKPFAVRAAKLCLWLPFVTFAGFTLVGAIIHGEGEKRFHKIIVLGLLCCLVWTSGIALGLIALRGMRTAGQKGILKRALVGLSFNAIFLGLFGWAIVFAIRDQAQTSKENEDGSEQEYLQVKARVGGGEALDKALVGIAERTYVDQLLKLKRAGERYASVLTNPPVLDMALIKNREDLQVREKDVRGYLYAAGKEKDFFDDVPSNYEQELLKHKISPEARNRSIQEFVKSMNGSSSIIVAVRQADLDRGKIMLETLSLLDSNWGKWEYNPQKKRVQTSDSQLLANLEYNLNRIKELDANMLRLQNEAEELRKSRKQQ